MVPLLSQLHRPPPHPSPNHPTPTTPPQPPHPPAGVFNQFYTECQVVGSPEEDSRLLLAEATAVVMRQCFHLLGIKPLYRI